MDQRKTTSTEIPKWSALLVEAVNKPGLIMEAYTSFHNYSLGNQMLALAHAKITPTKLAKSRRCRLFRPKHPAG